MLKKARAEFGANKDDQLKNVSQTVRDSSRQIWLAGLGAFARAQQEGTKLFDALVTRGEGLEAKTRSVAAGAADAARGAAVAKAREMQVMAGETWDKLEQVFENRVARALGRLGVYTAADVEKLAQRVNELSAAVEALHKAHGIKARPASALGKRARPARAPRTVAGRATPVQQARKSGRKTARKVSA